MESNGVETYLDGWGMSIATQRAKERQNRTSDELVMAETRISRSQNLQVTDVRKWTDVRGVGRPEGSEIRNFSSG